MEEDEEEVFDSSESEQEEEGIIPYADESSEHENEEAGSHQGEHSCMVDQLMDGWMSF